MRLASHGSADYPPRAHTRTHTPRVPLVLDAFPRSRRLAQVLYYAQTIFEDAGMSKESAKFSDLYVGASKLAATLLAVNVVDRFGRRPLLLAGILIMLVALIMLFLAFAITYDWAGGESAEGMSPFWSSMTLVALIAYVTGYQVGFGPITWVLIGELFPLHSRARAIGFSVFANFSLNLLVTLTNAPLIDAVGQAALFGVYAGMCVVSLAFVFVVVPETKGKSLEEIEAMLRT